MITSPDVFAYTENGKIVISGLRPNEEYAIYDLSGRLHAKGKSSGEPVKTEASNGAYAVKANGRSFIVIVGNGTWKM